MVRPVLVDTDVLVDFLRGRPEAMAFVEKNSARIILSSIVVAELATLTARHYPMIKGASARSVGGNHQG